MNLYSVCKQPLHTFGLSKYEEDGFVNWAWDKGQAFKRVERLEWYIVDREDLKLRKQRKDEIKEIFMKRNYL
jgi:hypothetical protein